LAIVEVVVEIDVVVVNVDVDVVVVGVSVVLGVVVETDDLTILGIVFFSFAFVDKNCLKNI